MDGDFEYHWVGKNRSGETVRGQLNAKNITLAKIALHQQGIQAKKIRQTQTIFSYFKKTRIKSQHITQLTRQLANLLQANIPLVQAFDLLQQNEKNQRIQTLLLTIQTDIKSGIPLADALLKHPKYFNALFCHMIKAGEVSGALVNLLKQLSTHQETLEKLKQKIKKSLAYPIAILSIALTVTTGLLLFVVPQFQILFKSFDANLPRATQWLIQASSYIKNYGFMTSSLLIFAFYVCRYFYQNTYRIKLSIDTILLKLPYFGVIIQDIIIARLSQILSILLSAGLPLVEALQLSANATNNQYYANTMLHVQTTVTEGHALQRTLDNTGLFPNFMTQLIGIGEASGELNQMLAHLAKQQHDNLTEKLDMLSSLFEPILMAILGLWVGGLIIALYLPIFQLGAIVS